MLPLQAGLLALIWVALPWLLRRWLARLAAQWRGWPRTRVVGLSLSLFLGSLVVLVGGMWLVAQGGGLTANGFSPWAWAVVGVVGAFFVMMQTLAAMSLVMLAAPETSPTRPSSDSGEVNR